MTTEDPVAFAQSLKPDGPLDTGDRHRTMLALTLVYANLFAEDRRHGSEFDDEVMTALLEIARKYERQAAP